MSIKISLNDEDAKFLGRMLANRVAGQQLEIPMTIDSEALQNQYDEEFSRLYEKACEKVGADLAYFPKEAEKFDKAFKLVKSQAPESIVLKQLNIPWPNSMQGWRDLEAALEKEGIIEKESCVDKLSGIIPVDCSTDPLTILESIQDKICAVEYDQIKSMLERGLSVGLYMPNNDYAHLSWECYWRSNEAQLCWLSEYNGVWTNGFDHYPTTSDQLFVWSYYSSILRRARRLRNMKKKTYKRIKHLATTTKCVIHLNKNLEIVHESFDTVARKIDAGILIVFHKKGLYGRDV